MKSKDFSLNKQKRSQRGSMMIEYIAIVSVIQIAILAAVPLFTQNILKLDSRMKQTSSNAYPSVSLTDIAAGASLD